MTLATSYEQRFEGTEAVWLKASHLCSSLPLEIEVCVSAGWCNVVGLIALTASTAQATLYTAVGMVQILTGVVLSPEVQVLMLWGEYLAMRSDKMLAYLKSGQLGCSWIKTKN